MGSEEVDTVSISQIFCGKKNRNRMLHVRGYNVKKSFHFKMRVCSIFSADGRESVKGEQCRCRRENNC